MLAPTKQVNLRPRGNSWYTRVYVPEAVQHLIDGRKEITHTIVGAVDQKDARLKAEEFRLFQFQRFNRLLAHEAEPTRRVTELSDEDIIKLARMVYIDFRADSDAEIATFILSSPEAQETNSIIPEERDALLRELMQHFGLADGARLWTNRVLKDSKIDLPNTSASYTKLLTKVRFAINQAVLIFVNALADTPNRDVDATFVDMTSNEPLHPAHVGTYSADKRDFMLGPLIDEFLEEIKSQRGKKGQAKLCFTLDIARRHIGRTADIRNIARRDIISLRTLFSRIPKNMSKYYKGMPPATAADLRSSDHPVRSISTVNTDVRNIKQFLTWCSLRDESYRPPNLKNTKIIDPVEDIDKRDPFTQAELEVIFRSQQMRQAAQTDAIGYWAYCIAMYTCLRANEIASLAPTDIVSIDGIVGISLKIPPEINYRGGKTKTIPRLLPLPKDLQNLGLAKLAQSRNGERTLFADVKLASDGYFSRILTDWTTSLLTDLDIRRRDISFHSFRHTAKMMMEDADLHDRDIAYIGGWKLKDVMHKTYGKDRYPPNILTAINKIDYGEIGKLLRDIKK
ncbi:site-specific recombinase, phage integrase family protein [Rhodobacterales bacterium HTCC2150]|nr:site-specific recombinase, phage integrase family protein [Rhodobacterales bacterium HTCC2150] [Rhodobacteraceae bacterium HTCC2150]